MYNYYPSQQLPYAQQSRQLYQQMPSAIGLKGRPVSSVEEAKAATIDFDGSIFYFPDIANNCIYTKQVNMDGSATINVYELRKMPVQSAPVDVATFITRDEFEQAFSQLRSELFPQKNTIQF